MNVYNTVITSLAVVSCDRLLSDRTTLAYVVVATLILTSTTTALCLLFLPKVRHWFPLFLSPCVVFVAIIRRLDQGLFPARNGRPCVVRIIRSFRSSRRVARSPSRPVPISYRPSLSIIHQISRKPQLAWGIFFLFIHHIFPCLKRKTVSDINGFFSVAPRC